jgi:transposase InsO family protein
MQRKPEAGLNCHSDRGGQYASGDYHELLTKAKAICSMSRKVNCYDNTPVESFFASMKREFVHRRSFATHEEARSAVFEWIPVWYNRKRRHSTLGYLSPE